MKKSVYSLVLADDVVQAVDQLAYSMNTSRSNMINQILADYCSCLTPEKRMKDIFCCVEQMIRENHKLQVQLQPSEAMMSIRSPLRYKYRPTIRYSVELYRHLGLEIGELRVSLRTQSRPLLDILTQFFELWNKLEIKYIGKIFMGGKIPAHIEDGRYTRQFVLSKEAKESSSEELGNAIASYIERFDYVMAQFFEYLQDVPVAIQKTEEAYCKTLAEKTIL